MGKFRLKYRLYYCFTSNDLYETINPSKWNVTTATAEKSKYSTNRQFCAAVLAYFFYLVFLDIIAHNVTFEFPLTGGHSANIYVKCFQDEEFYNLYAKGKFRGIDFLKSEFKGYQLYFQWRSYNKIREKPIYLGYKLTKWFYSKINQGKQYY